MVIDAGGVLFRRDEVDRRRQIGKRRGAKGDARNDAEPLGRGLDLREASANAASRLLFIVYLCPPGSGSFLCVVAPARLRGRYRLDKLYAAEVIGRAPSSRAGIVVPAHCTITSAVEWSAISLRGFPISSA